MKQIDTFSVVVHQGHSQNFFSGVAK